jgi:hypothetical protein
MSNQPRLLRFLIVASCTIAATFAAAGGCGSRNLIGYGDGGAGVRGPAGTAGTGPAGGGGLMGTAGTGLAGVGGLMGTAGTEPNVSMDAAACTNILPGDAGALDAAGTFEVDGSISMCQSGLYVPPPQSQTMFAGPTSSTPLPVAPPIDYAVGSTPYSLAAGDLNGDGKVDLVVGSYDSGLKVLFNTGCGAFSSPVSYAHNGMVALGDLSGDGKLDIVVADQHDVWVFVNDGKGNFPPPIAPVNRTPGLTLSFPAVGDFNKDGRADIVVSDGPYMAGDPDLATVILNQGGGKFAMPVSSPLISNANMSVSGLVLADVDGDGCPEVVVSHLGEGSLTVARNACDGTASLGAPQSWRTGGAPSGVAVGALAVGAATPDLVASLSSTADINIFGAGSHPYDFAPAVRYNAGAGSTAVALGDVDGDGDLDVVVALSGGIGVLLNNGDGTFPSPLTALSPCGGSQDQVSSGPVGLALGDFDGDGHLDFAASSNNTDLVTVYLNRLK